MIKSGRQNGKQRHQCKDCNKRFGGKKRLNPDVIWQGYTLGKQTAEQLAQHYQCSSKTIYRQLSGVAIKEQYATPDTANIIMDTTYFGRQYGIMVLYDSISRQALHVAEVKYETNLLYAQAVHDLENKGIEIKSIVCDGRRGLLQLFPDIPVQLCQFHQVQIVTGYLTRNPKTDACKALRQLVLTLKDSNKAAFQAGLGAWFEQYHDFLNERTFNEVTGKSHYTHKRLRSAYLSLKRNLPYLFTFESYPDLCIPNTTNLLDGRFADLKQKLRCHQGMRKRNKIKFIKNYFSRTIEK